jgi:hypothetical protein
VAGCCECGDEPSGSCATELVSFMPDKNIAFIDELQMEISLGKHAIKSLMYARQQVITTSRK